MGCFDCLRAGGVYCFLIILRARNNRQVPFGSDGRRRGVLVTGASLTSGWFDQRVLLVRRARRNGRLPKSHAAMRLAINTGAATSGVVMAMPRRPWGQLVGLLSALVLTVACTDAKSGHQAVPSPSPSHTAAPSETPSPSPSASASSHPAPPSASPTATPSRTTTQAVSAFTLLTRLRTWRFSGASLPSHLRVTGVGMFTYVDAGHLGRGYIGSAEVRIRSDSSGEQIYAIYDVYDTTAHSLADFGGSLKVDPRLRLSPVVPTACFKDPSPPGDTTHCRLHYGRTNATGILTIPSAADSQDIAAVMQAMLSHLLAVLS